MNIADTRTSLHLLCVTDDPLIRVQLEQCTGELPATARAEEPAWSSSTATSPDAALNLLAGGRVDAVLIAEGRFDAADFIRAIRDRGILTPIVAVTGSAEPAVWQPLLDAGADEFLPADALSPLLLERTLRLCTRTDAFELRVDQLAQHDVLTGLPSRKLFERQLDQALHIAHRHGRSLALVCLRLDHFQDLVHRAGQDAGERVLKIIARRLRALLRRSDLVARTHGEEYLLLLESCSDLSDVAANAARILDVLNEPIATGGIEMQPGVSMGIAVFPRCSTEPEGLLEAARVAMEQVINAGGNDFRLYDEALEVVSHRRVLMENALPAAISRGEMSIRYQPRFDLPSRRMVGIEVLLRWHSPDFGTVSPDLFIPVAESTGAIIRLGDWVLTQAVDAARAWHAAGHPMRVAVNVSAGQFRGGDFPERVRHALAGSSLPPELLELELTESVFVANVAQHRALFAALNDLGISLTIDDFGTGYSALAYLRHFPVHALKIDRTFIAPLPESEDDAAIVRAIVAMAHALDLRVVAEGVDAPGQIAFLEALGCDEIQGFLVGEPMTVEEMTTVLAQAPLPWPV